MAPILKRLTFQIRNVRYNSFKVQGNMISDGPVLGAKAHLSHCFDMSAVKTFAAICGDNNPIHLNEEYAKKAMFGKPIAHGMLVASLFSTIFGRTINSSVYVNQNLVFRAPVYVGTPVKAEVEIIKLEKKSHGYFIRCSTKCFLPDNTLAVDGDATVLIPLDEYHALVKTI